MKITGFISILATCFRRVAPSSVWRATKKMVLRVVYYGPWRWRIDRKWYSATTVAPDFQLAKFLGQSRRGDRQFPTADMVLADLYQTSGDPYVGFVPDGELSPASKYGLHLSSETLVAAHAVLGRKIRAAVEVGSFIGNSAVLLGKSVELDGGVLLCVDTWLGDINMWLGGNFAQTMAFKHGSPRIYERFLTRILVENLSKSVLPVRLPSTVAARMFGALNYHFDLVYLDSAHEFGETYLELNLFHDLLAPGGVLIGDDYRTFPAVKHDLDLFVAVKRLSQFKMMEDGNTWMIQRPHDD